MAPTGSSFPSNCGGRRECHALVEAFSTLTGFYKIPVEAATELTLALKANLDMEPLSWADYETAIR